MWDYLNIPIESIFYFGSQKSKAYLLLGIYVDFLLRYDVPKDPQDKSEKTDFWTFDPQRDKSFAYGGKCGLGYQRKIGFGQLSLEAYITYGFSNIMFTIDRSTDIPDMSNHWEEVRYKMDQKDEARRLYFLYVIFYSAGFAHKISTNF